MAVARVTLTGLLYGSVVQNVIHFFKADYVTSELTTLSTQFRDQWLNTYRNFCVTETLFTNIKCERVSSGVITDMVNLPIAITGGAGNDVRSPLMMALVIQLKSGLGGRRNRGRIFAPGTSVGAMVNGVWTSASLAVWAGYITTLTNVWITGSSGTAIFRLCILGKNASEVDKVTVTSMNVRTTPGCQRRRELGVGI